MISNAELKLKRSQVWLGEARSHKNALQVVYVCPSLAGTIPKRLEV